MRRGDSRVVGWGGRWFTPAAFVSALSVALATVSLVPPGSAQEALATVSFQVRHGQVPARGVRIQTEGAGAVTDAGGRATVRLPPGTHVVTFARVGFAPETLSVALAFPMDTTLVVLLREQATHLEPVIVTATRTGRRVEDEPTRVEVLPREEVEEKLLMTPGDVAMLMNETGGLRVQTTSPSLGGATVRIQGLRGRYTQILADGLPLYGGQAGSLGLLQIPPMDLAQIEVIKGAASALYGPAALGGVVNLVSRRPAPDPEVEMLLNQTTRIGTDGVLWASGPLSGKWSYTLLAGGHRQARQDVDVDGWADLPGYERLVLRPRLWEGGAAGRSVFLTGGLTLESRTGGTLPGRLAPDGAPFPEELETRRIDLGGVGRFPLQNGLTVSLRGSAMEQRHGHLFGLTPEDDRHRTAFAEATLGGLGSWGAWIAGAAFQYDGYRADNVPGFDYGYSIPSLFAQGDVALAEGVSLLASGRLDGHDEYGLFLNPRVSVLAKIGGDWAARLSAGTASFAPTPFTEETEVTGLSPLVPPAGLTDERAVSVSVDVSGTAGALELSAALFGAVIRRPVTVGVQPGGTLELLNTTEATRSYGLDALARWVAEPFRVTATYQYQRSTELDPGVGARRETPLTPRHAAGVVAAWEREGQSRVGVELYYTGRQALEDNPYRSVSVPYFITGFLAEHRLGPARLFVNAENLTNVRLSRYHSLVLPSPGRGGRWTTDAWTELSGRTINGGVRWQLR